MCDGCSPWPTGISGQVIWPAHPARVLTRSVRYLAGEASIRQFLDIGTGIPAVNNTHEVAQSIVPAAGVVYVDNDRCKSGCAQTRWTGQAV